MSEKHKRTVFGRREVSVDGKFWQIEMRANGLLVRPKFSRVQKEKHFSLVKIVDLAVEQAHFL